MQFVDDEMFPKQSSVKNKTELDKKILHQDKEFELGLNAKFKFAKEIQGEAVLEKSTDATEIKLEINREDFRNAGTVTNKIPNKNGIDGKMDDNISLRQLTNENRNNREAIKNIYNEEVMVDSVLGIVQIDSEIFSETPLEETQIYPELNREVRDETNNVVPSPSKKISPTKAIVDCGTYPNLSTCETEIEWNASEKNVNQNKEHICFAESNGEDVGCSTSIEMYERFSGFETNEAKMRPNNNGKIQCSVENILDGNKVICNDTRNNGTWNKLHSRFPMDLNILEESKIMSASKNGSKCKEDVGKTKLKYSDQINCPEISFERSETLHDNENISESVNRNKKNPQRCNKKNKTELNQMLENDEFVVLNLSPSEVIATIESDPSFINKVGKETSFTDSYSVQRAKPANDEISVVLQREKSEICGRIDGNEKICFPKHCDQSRSSGNKQPNNEKYLSNSSKGSGNLLKLKTKHHIHCMCKSRCCKCFKNKMLDGEYSIRNPNRIETFGKIENKHSNMLKKAYSYSRMPNPNTRSKFSCRKKNDHCIKGSKQKFQIANKYLAGQNASKEMCSSFEIKNQNTQSNQFSIEREHQDSNRGICLLDGKYHTRNPAHYISTLKHRNTTEYPSRTLEGLKKEKALSRKKNYGTDPIKKTLEIRRLRSLVRRQMDEINNCVKQKGVKKDLLTVGSRKLEKEVGSMRGNIISNADNEYFQGETNSLEGMELFLLYLKGRKRKLTVNNSGLSDKKSNYQIYSKLSSSRNQKDLAIKDFYCPEAKYEVNNNEDKRNPFNNEYRDHCIRVNMKPLKELVKANTSENKLEDKRNRVNQIQKVTTEFKQFLDDNKMIEHRYAPSLGKSKAFYFNQEVDTENLPSLFLSVTGHELDRKVPERKDPCCFKDINNQISKFPKKSKNKIFNKDKRNKISVPEGELSEQTEHGEVVVKDSRMEFQPLLAGRIIENASKNRKECWNETTPLEEMEAFLDKLRTVRMETYKMSKINYCISTCETKEKTSDQITDEKRTNIEGRIISRNECRSQDKQCIYPRRGDEKFLQNTVSNSSIYIVENLATRKFKCDDERVLVTNSDISRKVDETRHFKETSSASGLKSQKENQTDQHARNKKRPCYVTDRSHKFLNKIRRKRIKLGKVHR